VAQIPAPMDLHRVKEIMIPLSKYPHIPYWFTIRQAIVEMEKSELDIDGRKSLPRGVLVFDEKYRLMGVVRRRDILKRLEPEIPDQNSGSVTNAGESKSDVKSVPVVPVAWVTEMKKRGEHQVCEIMMPIGVTINSEDQLVNAINKMVDNDLSIIPVMKDDKVIGVVRSVDVFHEIAKLML
jgi:predicted transcriptional regulator